LICGLHHHAACSTEGLVLQALGKRPQALVEACSIVPKRRVSRVRHHLDLGVGQAGLVLLDSGWFDDRIASPVRDQYGRADPGKKIVVVEGAREQSLADVGPAIPAPTSPRYPWRALDPWSTTPRPLPHRVV
jgi:hypothetical protein